MVMRLRFVLFLLFLSGLPLAAGGGDILFNGTHIYLATGDSTPLYQGYTLSFKSVSSDGSMWFQLMDNDTIVKNEIVYSYGSFMYNKTNRTIISLKVEKVYSGPSDQNLVSFFLYQFYDPEKPYPDKTIIPGNPVTPENTIPLPQPRPSIDPLVWVPAILLVTIIYYLARKLW
ncbi:Uncharacterised protein [uncultured archaeon]|nr:Uncharacterised protein [uncultured archaeon]